jgi:hypothetical protein
MSKQKRKKMKRVELEVKDNNSIIKEQCPICGRFYKYANIPYWVFLRGTWSAVCYRCLKKKEPLLLEVIESANEHHWFKSNLSSRSIKEDGGLKCFGAANEYYIAHFHCEYLIKEGCCNEALKGRCWEASELDPNDDIPF